MRRGSRNVPRRVGRSSSADCDRWERRNLGTGSGSSASCASVAPIALFGLIRRGKRGTARESPPPCGGWRRAATGVRIRREAHVQPGPCRAPSTPSRGFRDAQRAPRDEALARVPRRMSLERGATNQAPCAESDDEPDAEASRSASFATHHDGSNPHILSDSSPPCASCCSAEAHCVLALRQPASSASEPGPGVRRSFAPTRQASAITASPQRTCRTLPSCRCHNPAEANACAEPKCRA